MLVHYQRAVGAVWRHAHGRVFVLPRPDSNVVVLTGTGGDLWWLLEESMTIDEAANRLAEVYRVAADKVSQDITPVVNDLAARSVLDRG